MCTKYSTSMPARQSERTTRGWRLEDAWNSNSPTPLICLPRDRLYETSCFPRFTCYIFLGPKNRRPAGRFMPQIMYRWLGLSWNQYSQQRQVNQWCPPSLLLVTTRIQVSVEFLGVTTKNIPITPPLPRVLSHTEAFRLRGTGGGYLVGPSCGLRIVTQSRTYLSFKPTFQLLKSPRVAGNERRFKTWR